MSSGSKLKTNGPPGQDGDHEAGTIPIAGEKYSISKKLLSQDFVVEKRWETRTVSVQVPVRYEEIYVNGKKFGSGLDGMLSSLGGSLRNESEEDRLSRKKAELKGELIPLYDSDNGSSATEERFVLLGEEITINKRMRTAGEAIITKRRVTENKKVPIKVRGERVTVKHPGGSEQQVASGRQ